MNKQCHQIFKKITIEFNEIIKDIFDEICSVLSDSEDSEYSRPQGASQRASQRASQGASQGASQRASQGAPVPEEITEKENPEDFIFIEN